MAFRRGFRRRSYRRGYGGSRRGGRTRSTRSYYISRGGIRL